MTTTMIITGFGGQGILFAGKILAYAALQKGKRLSWLPSYGPEMRGGAANCHVIISDEPVGSPIIINPDILVTMNKPSFDKFEGDIIPGGTAIIDKSLIDRETTRKDIQAVYVDATNIADANGKGKLANMVMLGALIKKTGIFTMEELRRGAEKSIPESKKDLLEMNMDMIRRGYDAV